MDSSRYALRSSNYEVGGHWLRPRRGAAGPKSGSPSKRYRSSGVKTCFGERKSANRKVAGRGKIVPDPIAIRREKLEREELFRAYLKAQGRSPHLAMTHYNNANNTDYKIVGIVKERFSSFMGFLSRVHFKAKPNTGDNPSDDDPAPVHFFARVHRLPHLKAIHVSECVLHDPEGDEVPPIGCNVCCPSEDQISSLDQGQGK